MTATCAIGTTSCGRVVSSVEPDHHLVKGKVHQSVRTRTDAVDFTPPSCGAGIDATFRFKGVDHRR